MGYPDPSAFCSNVDYVLAEEICFIFRKHEVRSKEFTPDLMFAKYEADLLCQNMSHITTKGRGIRVSLPLCGKGIWKGKVVWKCVHTKRGVKSTHVIKCVERVFSFACLLFCLYLRYQSVWKMCGKSIIFINTFHTIRVLSNFAGRTGYTTFPSRRPQEYWLLKINGCQLWYEIICTNPLIRDTDKYLGLPMIQTEWCVQMDRRTLSNASSPCFTKLSSW